jgi:hypothetical protein
VALRIKASQALLQGKPRIVDWRDDNMIAFNRHAHALIDMEVRYPRHRGRQANTQIVAPLFDAQDSFGHELTPGVHV